MPRRPHGPSSSDSVQPPHKKKAKVGRPSAAAKLKERSATADPGPASVQELWNWPTHVVQALLDPMLDDSAEMKCRLQMNILGGMQLYTDYSGIECPAEAMRLGIEACRREYGWSLPDECFRLTRTSDKEKLQTKVLVALSGATDAPCHFGDILERLPQAAQEWIAAATPDDKATKTEKIDAYKCIHDWIRNNLNVLFSPDMTCPCHVHKVDGQKAKCRVYPSGQQDKSVIAMGSQHRTKAAATLASSRGMLKNSGGPGPGGMKMNVAGVTCHGWTTEGHQDRFGHPSEIPHAVWLSEREYLHKNGLEHLFFSECTRSYPVREKQANPLKGISTVKWVYAGPEDFGWPHRRPRVLSVGLCDKLVEWVGPEDVQADFAARFTRSTVLRGQHLFMSDDDERSQAYSDVARARKFKLSAAEAACMPLGELAEKLLAPHGNQHLQEWRTLFENKFAAESAECSAESDEIGSALICDVDHTPHSKGSVGGSEWPVQLTHGHVVCMNLDDGGWKLATKYEHMGAMGFHVHANVDSAFPISKLRQILGQLSDSQVKVLMGNAMHLVTQCAWQMYVLSNIQVKERTVKAIPRFLPMQSTDDFGVCQAADDADNE